MANSNKSIFKEITSVISNPRETKISLYNQSSVNGVSHEQIRLLIPYYKYIFIQTINLIKKTRRKNNMAMLSPGDEVRISGTSLLLG